MSNNKDILNKISEEYAAKAYDKNVHDAYNGTSVEELIALIDSDIDIEKEIKK